MSRDSLPPSDPILRLLTIRMPEWHQFTDVSDRPKTWKEISSHEHRPTPTTIGCLARILTTGLVMGGIGVVVYFLVGGRFPGAGPTTAAVAGFVGLFMFAVIARYFAMRATTRRVLRSKLSAGGHPICVGCGYLLRNLDTTSFACPECGFVIPIDVRKQIAGRSATDPDSMHDPTQRMSLDPDPEAMRAIGYALVDRLIEDHQNLGERAVGRLGTGPEFHALVDEPMPESPTNINASVDWYLKHVAPNTTRVDHPRFFAFVPCPSSFAGVIGQTLAAAMNPFAGSWLGGGATCALELVVLRWIAEMLDLPGEMPGIFTSGGSVANLIALAAARARMPDRHHIMKHGRIYVSREGHASMTKAAATLGFEPETIRHVDVDGDLKMNMHELAQMIADDRRAGHTPFFVAANAGTTNSGVIDPLPALADLCATEQLWLHVDGAYGGFAALTDRGRALLEGMNRADSLTLDPHKWLYCPIGVGCIFVRDRAALEAAFSTDGNYLRDLPPDEVHFMTRGPELTRPARVLSVWMVLRTHGRRELARQIETDMDLAELAASLLREDDRFEVFGPGLSVVTFRHRSRPGEDEANRTARDDLIMKTTLDEGTIMLSSTTISGLNTLRLVVMHHRTTEADVRLAVRCIRAIET